jgi:intein/homing endonuclease
MSIIVIVGYKPKPGREIELEELMKTHHSILKQENLVSERDPIVAQAKDGTIVEVFEWVSSEAMRSAHENKNVLAMWQKYDAVCEYVPISTVPEARELFSGFTPLN